ncbi:BT_2262 family domain-containing protein [Labilibacter marinus]|uniref:BT_2262 family domain-containing protein n=1 Tax=Labilibacter marinus TaxID=1477105 RepID=UPI00095017E4|nr:BT_2262 family domain-containing protein [Labilibacter marinus]
MKNKILLFALVAIIVGFTSCDDETTANMTRITYYPTLELEGETSMIIDKGEPYEEPGYSSFLNGEDITDEVIVTSDVNTDEAGIYSVKYEVVNPEGFKVTKTRIIYVADPTPSPIETGLHDVLVGTHRINQNSGAKTDYDGYQILFLQTEPGVYYVSDFLGGYYDQRAGYGANYAMTGYFRLEADNTLTLISSYLEGWGDSLDGMKNASFNPTTGQIVWSVDYAGFLEFNVILN